MAVKCSSRLCNEPATKEWGIDKKPVCASCYAECEGFLDALMKENADVLEREPKETEA